MTKGVVHGVDFGHCAARHEGAGVNVRVSLRSTYTMYLYVHIIVCVILFLPNITSEVNERVSLCAQCNSSCTM